MNSPDSNSRRRFMAPCELLSLAAVAASLAGATGVKGPKGGRVLVAYFSRSGNTRVIAGKIARTLGAAVFEIEPSQPYPEDYFETVEQARRERDSGLQPGLRGRVANLDEYDVVYLGFPIWGETAPPVTWSFLASPKLAGKTLIPFITHGGYGLGGSRKVVAAHAPGARQSDAGLVIQADQERRTVERVGEWLEKNRP